MAESEFEAYNRRNREREKEALRERLEADRRSLALHQHNERMKYMRDRDARLQDRKEEDFAKKRAFQELENETMLGVAKVNGDYGLENTRLETESASYIARLKAEVDFKIAELRSVSDLSVAEAQGRTAIKVEKIRGKNVAREEEIKGGNQNRLAIIKSTLDHAGKTSDVINYLFTSVIDESKNWSNTLDNMISQLVLVSANLEAQIQTKIVDHRNTLDVIRENQFNTERTAHINHNHSMQGKSLDHRHRVDEKILDHQLAIDKLSFEQVNLVVSQLVQKRLGIGNNESDEAIKSMVAEAMAAARGGGY
jgi:hypothetical protein